MKRFLILLAMTHSLATFAQFENITLVGSGCPQGSFQKVISPDGKSLSIIFEKMTSQVEWKDPRNLPNSPRGRLNQDLKTCSIAFRALIPQGQQLDSLDVQFDQRGHVFLEGGARAQFQTVLTKALEDQERPRGQRILFNKNWNSAANFVDEDILVRLNTPLLLSSPCAVRPKRVNIELQSMINTIIPGGVNNQGAIGQLLLETHDYKASIQFILKTRSCAVGRGGFR
jgi:hypothetical protein